ncbi:sodium:dicarboxylate symporter [Methylobacterium sp. 4-46]|uniref:dicarboxylate/amino acid:cation symporter n=1 Tax=unclassified Methylobacterium TaxID=2615210 RepID=UPI000152C18D|nr:MULTISPECIES: dicarboxylate/amino acid:cation symporter [Methylobacterium]ACA20692.1 sodium:dicarboxylate symporter [Methylobacterium sp. 4-46]WFT79850.1 dicarboxylate/amino acid:cation symporter [Methylobacterium nodulans]
MTQVDAAPRSGRLTLYTGIGLVLGIAVGAVLHGHATSPDEAKALAAHFTLVTDIFLRLIKMIIAPLVFATIVAGIASFGDTRSVGRVAGLAMGWFLTASLVSLTLGLIAANLFQPGAGLALPLPDAGAQTGLKAASLNLRDFLTHVFPTSIVSAMAGNEVLQILVFSIFFGFGLSAIDRRYADPMVHLLEGLARVMFKVTDAVMRLAPLAVFAAMAAVVTVQGLGVLLDYGKFIVSFYVGLAVLWALLIGAGWLVLGRATLHLLRLLRAPMIVAFSTASSEAAFPRTIEVLARFGVRPRVTGFVLPLGYSFNLDGSMMYQALAALFIAQAFGIPLGFTEQVMMLLVMMVTSKGIAGVPRASLVVVAATVPMFGLPSAGILLIMGIDQILDMGRTVTNVLGNGLATAAVAKWQGELEETASPEGRGRTSDRAVAEALVTEAA